MFNQGVSNPLFVLLLDNGLVGLGVLVLSRRHDVSEALFYGQSIFVLIVLSTRQTNNWHGTLNGHWRQEGKKKKIPEKKIKKLQ